MVSLKLQLFTSCPLNNRVTPNLKKNNFLFSSGKFLSAVFRRKLAFSVESVRIEMVVILNGRTERRIIIENVSHLAAI